MYDTLAVIEIETTGPDPRCDRIVEMGLVVCRPDLPPSAVSERFLATGGRTVEEALAELYRSLPADTTYLAHDAERTAAFLRAAAPGAPGQLMSTNALARICIPGQSDYDRAALGEALGLFGERLPAERILARCELTWRLWKRILETARAQPPVILDSIDRLLGAHRDDPVRMFFHALVKTVERSARGRRGRHVMDAIAEERLAPARREIPQPASYRTISAEDVAATLGPTGPFAERLQGYECREEQTRMTAAVVDAFNTSRHLLVEAGTGVGKSLAYLVPAVYWATVNRTPVVISTNTKNLQSQLFAKDIPMISGILDVPFTAALIKGRQNYLCLRKLDTLAQHGGAELEPAARRALAGVLIWAGMTRTGDLSEVLVGTEEYSAGLGTALTSAGEECRGRSCPARRQCFLYRARRRAMAADVIVANHAVVLKEMGAGEGSPVLPPYAHIIFDEAHNLEDAATSLMSREISLPRLRTILHRLCGTGKKRKSAGFVPDVMGQIENAPKLDATEADKAVAIASRLLAEIPGIDPVSERFFEKLAAALSAGGRQESIRIFPERKTEAWWAALDEERANLTRALAKLQASTQELAGAVGDFAPETFPEGADLGQDLNAAAVWLHEYRDDLGAVFQPDDGNGVSWVERVGAVQGGVRAWSAPIRVGPGLAEALYNRKQSVIFTSATLTAGGSFKFMRGRLGVDGIEAERVAELVLGTPFDFARQCRVLVPTFLPEPGGNDDAYVAAMGPLLAEVFHRTRGRAMVLFTSFDMLRKAARILHGAMDGTGITILEQGVSGSREGITEVFRRDVQSVLLGAQSFWEGVDVVGESLSCLVMARLPFAVFTDPVVTARCDQIEASGGNAFTGYALPSAVIRFRQGFGRLIRHRRDRGLVIITDPRIMTKRYGQWFRRSLPVPVIAVPDRGLFLEDVEAFFTADL